MMSAPHYYNEFEPYAAQWLRNLITAGLLPAGEVDTRSIVDVKPDDLAGFRQCHFFAGIGGWALAARLAGWPEDRELWTGSCPCQPFSVAGSQRGTDDERHLWPHQLRLLRARRPAVWMGEQVAAAVGKDWLDGVLSDLEGIGYAGRAVVVPACAVDGPHRRDRLWLVAGSGAVDHGERSGLEEYAGHDGAAFGRQEPDRPVTETGCGSVLANADRFGRQINPDAGRCEDGSGSREVPGPFGARHGHVADGDGGGRESWADDQAAGHREAATAEGRRSAWDSAGWIIGHDGKARRVEPGVRLLAHGLSARVGRLRAYGNAIVPQVAAEVIAAYMECRP